MTFAEFQRLLQQDACPDQLSPLLKALWWDFQGQWDRAHAIVQNLSGRDAARVHAYLHRKEGDNWNSKYWHRQAGTAFRDDLALEEEWRGLVESLL